VTFILILMSCKSR